MLHHSDIIWAGFHISPKGWISNRCCLELDSHHDRCSEGSACGKMGRTSRTGLVVWTAILADNGGFIAPEFLQTPGDNGNYILTRATWSKDLAEANPLVGTVNQMFKERYGANMTGNSARAFTGMLVLADAINRAGSTDSEAIREALLETNMPGDKLIMPWGGIRFDHETHQNTLGKGIIYQINAQEYYTVWPWNLATKVLIWQMP